MWFTHIWQSAARGAGGCRRPGKASMGPPGWPEGPFQAKKSSQAHAAVHACDGKLPLFRASSISFS